MIKKMPTYNRICKILKELGTAIPEYEKLVAVAIERRDTATDPDPVLLKKFVDGMTDQIEWLSAHLNGMKEAYKAILGVEYGSEQTHIVYKPSLKTYLSSTLYRRGITKVEYEDIESDDGRPWVRIYWTEKIE